jgi:EpsI family protein
MKPLHRATAALCLMLACSGLAAWFTPTILMSEQRSQPLNLEQDVPQAFGPWVAETNSVGVVNPQAQEMLDRIYTEVLTRSYVDPATGRRIMLSIAYGADQRRREGTQLHQPEICYPAQGFEINSNRTGLIQVGTQSIPVHRLETVHARQRFEPVTYWTMTGDKAVVGGYQRKLVELSYGLAGLVPDGLLFRVSSIGQDSPAQFDAQAAFVRDMLAALSPRARLQLSGTH